MTYLEPKNRGHKQAISLKKLVLIAFSTPPALTVLHKLDPELDFLPTLKAIISNFGAIMNRLGSDVSALLGIDLHDNWPAITFIAFILPSSIFAARRLFHDIVYVGVTGDENEPMIYQLLQFLAFTFFCIAFDVIWIVVGFIVTSGFFLKASKAFEDWFPYWAQFICAGCLTALFFITYYVLVESGALYFMEFHTPPDQTPIKYLLNYLTHTAISPIVGSGLITLICALIISTCWFIQLVSGSYSMLYTAVWVLGIMLLDWIKIIKIFIDDYVTMAIL